MQRSLFLSLFCLLGLLACQSPAPPPQGPYDFIRGEIAFVPYEREIQILDISDPQRPLRLGRLSIGWPIVDVQARDETLFVLRRAESASLEQRVTNGGLLIFDISNPSQPEELAFTAYPPFPNAMGLLDQHVYISDHEKTIIYDISNLRNPTRETAELEPYTSFYRDGERWLAGFGSCDLRSGRCFGRFGAIDISNPERPQVTTDLIGQIPVFAVTVHEETVYTFGRGISAMPLDQLQPVENHHTPGFMGNYSGRIRSVGDHLLVAEGHRLLLFDTADPLRPVIVGEETSPPRGTFLFNFAVRGETVFAVSQYGLHVVDISQPTAPRGVALFDLTS